MATLFHSLTFLYLILLFSTVHARLPTTSPEYEAQKPYDSDSKILLPSEKPLESGPGSVMNIKVESQQNMEGSGKLSDENTVMPASGSFPGTLVDGGKNRLHKEKEIQMMVKWLPINRHLDRIRVIRGSFPVHCGHRRPRLDGGAKIRQRRSSISEEETDFVEGERRQYHRRYGKMISARWIDGTTFHRLDAVTIPDFVDGEGIVIGEFRSPRFIFHRNHRRHDHRKEGIGHVLWEKIRNFLINL